MGRRQRHLNPANAGVTAIYDARFISGLSDGAAVASWANRNASGSSVTQATNRPVYRATQQGGQPAVEFSGTSTNPLRASAALSGNNPKLLLAVYRSTRTGTYSSAVAGQSTGTATGSWFVMQARTLFVSGDPYIAGYSADTTADATSPDNAWKVATGYYNGSTLQTSKNGVSVDLVSRTLNTASANIEIGNSQGAGGEPLTGFIALCAISEGTFSAPLIKRLEHAAAYSFKLACS